MKENRVLTDTLLLIVVIFLLVIVLDFTLMNELIHPGMKFLKGFYKVHKNMLFIKFLYVILVYFYFGVMPRLKVKDGNGKFVFITVSLILSMLILVSGFLTLIYSVYCFPLILMVHIPFAGFAAAALKNGTLKNEEFFKDISNEKSEFYFTFGSEDGQLTVHKPQQNLWIDGGPGSGKSDTFIKAIISQSAQRGYAGAIYDWEGDPTQEGSPLLSQVAYGSILKAKKQNPNLKLEFAFINFTDMMRTVRVNVLSEKYFNEYNGALFIRNLVTTLMKNLEPAWKEKTDFWANNAINYVYSVAYLCYKQREKGINTLPHVISICLSDSDLVFEWISRDPEISKNMASMLTAYKLKAQQQTAGAVSSAQLPLSLLNNKYVFWVLSPKEEDEFSLDITNKERPVLLCLGNAPSIKEAISPAISCIFNILMGQMNRSGKVKSILCVDEFPTINLFGIDTFIGTARKHDVSTILAVQDFNQAVRDYGDKSAEILKASCGSQFFGMTGNKRTAQEIQDLFGENKQISESFSEQDSGGGSRSESLQREKIVHTRNVAGQPTGHFIGKIANGVPPFFSTQFDRFVGETAEIPPFAKKIITGDELQDRKIMENIIEDNYQRIERETKSLLENIV